MWIFWQIPRQEITEYPDERSTQWCNQKDGREHATANQKPPRLLPAAEPVNKVIDGQREIDSYNQRKRRDIDRRGDNSHTVPVKICYRFIACGGKHRYDRANGDDHWPD